MWGPLLFVLYAADLGGVMDKHGVNSCSYTDDSQLEKQEADDADAVCDSSASASAS